MPTLRPVLEKAHQQEFENPPLLTTPQRQLCFQLDESLKPILRGLDLPISQAGFLLQLGYFRATTRFFPLATFRQKDWAFVIRRLRLTLASIHPPTYADSTMRHHRQLILDYMQVEAFRGTVQQQCQEESDQLVNKGLRLPAVFGSLCDYLRFNRFEIPPYSKLAYIISRSVSRFQRRLEYTLQAHMQPHQKTLFANLLLQLPGEDGVVPANSPLLLTQLRDTDELMSVRAIRHNVVQMRHLKDTYYQCLPLIQALGLPDALIESYALQVMRSRGWQPGRRSG